MATARRGKAARVALQGDKARCGIEWCAKQAKQGVAYERNCDNTKSRSVCSLSPCGTRTVRSDRKVRVISNPI